MSTIITRNSATSGSQPSSLVQGELAINVTDNRLFFGSGSGNTVKEFGVTSSYALNALTASYAISASYEINYETSSSYADFAVSASHALNSDNAISSSYALTASYVQNAQTASYVQNAVSASYAIKADNAATLDLYSFTVPSNSYLLFSNTIAATGVAVGGNNDLRYNSSTKVLSAVNISATTLTGSLLGTASYATTALSASFASTASYIQNAQTASYVLNAVSASFASTASYVVNAQTASFVTASNVYGPYGSNSVISASYALNGGVTQLLAGPNIALSPTNGLGQVTITATLSGSNSYNTATGSYGSFYDTTTQTNPVANIARSMSFNSTDITNGVSISGSTNPFNTYIKTENAGIYNIQFSAQVEKTDSGTDVIVIWLRKNGIDLTDSATKLTLSGNGTKVVAAWNWFASSAANDYYQIIWVSADTGMRLYAEPINDTPGIPSVILTVNRVDQFLSNTGSFSGSFTGPLLGTASYATTASYVLQAVSASYATNSLSASFASTASYIQNAQTASYVLQAVSASFATTASFVQNAQTASYVLNAVSASYATNALSSSFTSTASYVNTLNQSVIITASMVIGSSSLGPSENTLTLGARDAANEGGQLGLNAPGGTYTSASFVDVWQNFVRILRGSNAGSDALVTQWNLHTKQMQLPAYTNASSFAGTATANLAVDSGGNVITVSTAGGSVFPYTGDAVITGSLTTTGIIYAQPNGGMYFQGGDDAALYDINVVNTMGIYGVQDSTIGSIKLGSGGGTISGKGSKIGIGTINPTNGTLEVNGNVYATSFTGSLLGTASYATQALSASYAPAGNPFPYNGNAQISGSLGVTGSFSLQTFNGLTDVTAISFDGVTRLINDVMGSTSINADDRDLYDSANINSISWESRRLLDSAAVGSIRWDLRSAYDTVDSQSIAWDARLLKIDNGPASYTVNWGSGILRDTGAKNSVDWENRTTIDTGNKNSIDWQNRQLKDSNGNENLNWSSGVSITGSLTVSGSSTFTNIGPARFSGSFIVQGALIPGSPPFIPDIGPYDAIKVDDITGQRLLYGSPFQGASASIDFGNRALYTSDGGDALSWSGQSGTYETFLYNQQYITETNRANLFGYNSYGGQILGQSYFDTAVMDNDLVYLNTDGQWYQVDQTTNTSTKMLGIAKNIFSQTGSVVIEGDIVVTTATGYPAVANAGYGLPVYIKQGAGTVMDTAIPVSGYVRLLGHCYWNSGGGGNNEWIMKFRPSHEWIEL